jgi:hypothetical protein
MLKSMGQRIKKEHTMSQKKDGNSRLFNVRLVRAIKP